MTRALGFPRRLGLAVLLLCSAALGQAADRKPFTTSTTLANEASTLTKLLDELHYNHDAVKSSDYAQVIPDYMSELDGQRLFFLNTDRVKFMEEHGKNVYYNTAFLGNINAAYEIFYVYQTRVENRIAWIFEQLKQEFDFAAPGTYRTDRKDEPWPANMAAADELWTRRLKFELVGELLNKKTIDEAKAQVRKRYERMLKNLGEIEGNDLAELYLGTIAKLYDPHSTYFSAATYEDFGIQMRLKLVGIGALLGLEEDVCIVKEIVPGGPADIGRELKPNDKIISVSEKGGEPVEIIGMKLRKIVDKIRGKKGTQVVLVVQPADATDSSVRKEIVITRDEVKLNNARARGAIFQLPDTDGKTQPIGVISLPAFYNEGDDGDTDSDKSSATKDVARLIEQLKSQGMQGLVLDLRRNGGGYLTEAISLAGLFIQKGPVVQVKSYTGEIHVDSDRDPKIAYTGPLAVLVDRFSASASEIVAGALQNYGRAIVIGDSSTHGKGSVQQVVEMKQLSRALALSPQKTGAAKFTIQKYYLPSGASTQLKGVVPDIVLPSIEDHLPIGEADLPRALVWDQIRTSLPDFAALDMNGDGSVTEAEYTAAMKDKVSNAKMNFANLDRDRNGGLSREELAADSAFVEPLPPKILTPLRQASVERQAKLEEFAYLRKYVDWFKARQEQKQVSVNLEERQKQKAADDAFRKELKVEKERLAKNDYPLKTFFLGPPPPPKIKAPKKDGEEEDELSSLLEDNDGFAKADVHLREALRVVNDAIALGRNRDLWASNRPPLTAQPTTGG